MTPTAEIEPLELGKHVMSILERGQKTATYKLATLTALIDYCVEHPADMDVPINDLAHRVIEKYWPQVQPFDGSHPLRQSAESAKILDAVKRLRTAAGADKHPGMLVMAAINRVPLEYERTRRVVRLVLVQQPLHRLQHLGGGPYTAAQAFLYDDSWMDDDVNQDTISRHGGVIRLRPGVASGLAQLSRLLKPAIEYVWVDMVWRKNQDRYKEVLDIKGHLFGRQRLPLGRVGRLLKSEFGAECFYCGYTLETDGQVDHVLPWSIAPIDGVANLVVACRRCNSSKSNNMPAVQHADRALTRDRSKLERIADAVGSEPENDRVVRVASNLYHQGMAEQSQVWLAVDYFISLDLSSPPEWMLLPAQS